MEEIEFDEELVYRTVPLLSGRDIVMFSFIVKKSISYLDLQLPPTNHVLDDDDIYNPLLSTLQFVNTEEKCRTLLAPSRSLLYTLNLDLPRGRELPLNEGRRLKRRSNTVFEDDSSLRHIGEIYVYKELYYMLISEFIFYGASNLDLGPKLFEWLFKFKIVKESDFHRLHTRVVGSFLKHIFTHNFDFRSCRNFFRKFKFKYCLSRYENLRYLEYFLYNAVLSRRNFEADRPSLQARTRGQDIIDFCFNNTFLNIVAILKCIDSPRLFSSHKAYISQLKRVIHLPDEVLRRAGTGMSEERRCLMLQVLIIAVKISKGSCIMTLCAILNILWNTVPAPFLSAQEMNFFFRELFEPEEIRVIQWFYHKIVGEYHERIEPRSLKHLSRVAVRKQLYTARRWIPVAVLRLNIPRELKTYLNLHLGFIKYKFKPQNFINTRPVRNFHYVVQ